MAELSPDAIKVRKRFKDDFRFYAKHALRIRTKEAKIVPLRLNAAQVELQRAIDGQVASVKPIRIIILKARQQGLSTHVGGYFYFRVSQSEASKVLVVAHKTDSTAALFDMTKRYHENCPEALRPSTKYSNKKQLVFDRLDSSYLVATAGGDGIARGETLQFLHASELAFWQPSSARENWNGLSQSVPEEANTGIIIESTANGVSGLFYEMWQGAVSGENGYVPVFIPWFLDPGYCMEVEAPLERTPMEVEIAERALREWNIVLSDEQLRWRRRKVAENGLDLFKQEYPAYPDEAFLTSGRPVFHPDIVADMKAASDEPIERRALEVGEWEEHPRGELSIYIPYDPKETYYIGADVGKGIRHGDYSVAQVLDSKRRQVSVWRGHVVSDHFAHILAKLGSYYNTAMLAVENNDHGILTCHVLSKDLDYPNLYQSVQHDKIDDRETLVVGFTTNVKTRPMVIDLLRANVRDKAIDIRDRTTLTEMQTFVFTESGKMEAESSCHDDTVLALAFANYVNDGEWKPPANKDSYYSEAI